MTSAEEVPPGLRSDLHGPAHLHLPEPPPATPDQVRLAFRRHAAGVAVITADSLDGPVGFTATSLASVSLEPPLLSFNVSRDSSSWPPLSRARHLGVHVLAAGQEDLAVRFATSGADRFGPPTAWSRGPHGIPLLDGVQAWLVTRLDRHVPAGDHTLVLVRVLHVGLHRDPAPPLVHHDGGFGTLVPAGRLRRWGRARR